MCVHIVYMYVSAVFTRVDKVDQQVLFALANYMYLHCDEFDPTLQKDVFSY